MDRAIPRLLLSAALLLLPGAALADEPPRQEPAPAPAPPPASGQPPAPASAPPPAPAQPPAAAAAPAPTPARQLPPANPFGELGAAGIVGGTFSLGVLIGCAASNIHATEQSQCILASGLTALGLVAVGIPLILIGRSRSVAWVPRVTLTAGTRGGVLGYAGSF
jgi:hypothetical protein